MSRFFFDIIRSFKHKGLKLFYEKGDSSKLQPQHVSKIRLILTRLDAVQTFEEMNVSGYGLHELKGNLKGFWSVKVDKNYRLIFAFEEKHVIEVDYIDYY